MIERSFFSFLASFLIAKRFRAPVFLSHRDSSFKIQNPRKRLSQEEEPSK